MATTTTSRHVTQLLTMSPGPQPPSSGLEQQRRWQAQQEEEEEEEEEEEPPTTGLEMQLSLEPWYVFFIILFLFY